MPARATDSRGGWATSSFSSELLAEVPALVAELSRRK